jgi:hypothetical protein
MLSTLGVEHSKPIRGARFEITLAHEGVVPVAAQIDGEEHPSSYHARVTVLKQALRLIVP